MQGREKCEKAGEKVNRVRRLTEGGEMNKLKQKKE